MEVLLGTNSRMDHIGLTVIVQQWKHFLLCTCLEVQIQQSCKNSLLDRTANMNKNLLWYASFSFFFIKRWSPGLCSLLPPLNNICWSLIRASCYVSLGPPGNSYLIIYLHIPNFNFRCMLFNSTSWWQAGAGMPRFWGGRYYAVIGTHLCGNIFLYDWTGNLRSCSLRAL